MLLQTKSPRSSSLQSPNSEMYDEFDSLDVGGLDLCSFENPKIKELLDKIGDGAILDERNKKMKHLNRLKKLQELKAKTRYQN